jgi:hypothetical protein
VYVCRHVGSQVAVTTQTQNLRAYLVQDEEGQVREVLCTRMDSSADMISLTAGSKWEQATGDCSETDMYIYYISKLASAQRRQVMEISNAIVLRRS